MKLRSILLKFLILALGIAGVFALSSCFTGSAIVLGSCLACSESCSDAGGGGGEKNPRSAVSYRLNDDGESYYVSQIEDVSEVEISAEYKGKPVTRIAAGAFFIYRSTGCGSEHIPLSISKLTLPASITAVDGSVEAYDSSIYEVNYLGTLEDWCKIDGAGNLFTGYTKLMIGGSMVTDFTAPESVTKIPDGLFKGYGYLTEAVLHNGVTSIGAGAFKNCKRLSALTLPDNDGLNIEEEAFQGCSSLESVTLPAGVKAVPELAFADCASLKTVHIAGVIEEIGGWCFAGCVKLEGVDLSASTITEIPEKAFADCRRICSFVIPSRVERIGADAFLGCKIYEIYNLSVLDLRGTHAAENAVEIHTSMAEPSVVYADGDYRFVKGAVNYLCAYFGGDDELTLPETFADGGEYVLIEGLFAESYITSVNIPDAVTDIRNNAFYNCKKLTAVTGCGGLLNIGANAFEGCAKLNSFEFGAALQTVGAYSFKDTPKLENIEITAESIGEKAFENSGLVFAVLNVKKIEYGAFKNCRYLAEVTLSEGLETVGTDAFAGCVSLKKLELPSTVTSCSGQSGLTSLEEVTVSKDNPKYKSAGNCIIETERKKLVIGCKTSVIPDDGSVEVIGSSAFEGIELDSLTLPESVKEIGWAAFRNSTVRQINCEFITDIDGYAFANCINLESVTLAEGLGSIDSYAFYHCEGLTSVVIPDSVTYIGGDAFGNCVSLESVTLSNSVKYILGSTFYNCGKLQKIVIHEGVKEVGRSAFWGCASLTEVVFPSTLEVISDYAFYGCKNLASVLLPNGASYGREAFDEITVIEYEKAADE